MNDKQKSSIYLAEHSYSMPVSTEMATQPANVLRENHEGWKIAGRCFQSIVITMSMIFKS